MMQRRVGKRPESVRRARLRVCAAVGALALLAGAAHAAMPDRTKPTHVRRVAQDAAPAPETAHKAGKPDAAKSKADAAKTGSAKSGVAKSGSAKSGSAKSGSAKADNTTDKSSSAKTEGKSTPPVRKRRHKEPEMESEPVVMNRAHMVAPKAEPRVMGRHHAVGPEMAAAKPAAVRPAAVKPKGTSRTAEMAAVAAEPTVVPAEKKTLTVGDFMRAAGVGEDGEPLVSVSQPPDEKIEVVATTKSADDTAEQPAAPIVRRTPKAADTAVSKAEAARIEAARPEVVKAAPKPIEAAEPVETAAVMKQPNIYGRNGRLVVPAPLKGTHEILVHQNAMADEEGLDRIQDDEELERLRVRHLLVDFPESATLHVNPELPANRRCARLWTVRMVTDMARAYAARFHQPLQVNSAARSVSYQLRLQRVNGNAAAVDGDGASPHLTGQAIDIAKRGMSKAQLAWMRAYLLPLMQAGKVDVEEEFQQACFHISVYKSYLPLKKHSSKSDVAELNEEQEVGNRK